MKRQKDEPSQKSQLHKSNFCGNCGLKLDRPLNFCPECGDRLEPVTRPPKKEDASAPLGAIVDGGPAGKAEAIVKSVEEELSPPSIRKQEPTASPSQTRDSMGSDAGDSQVGSRRSIAGWVWGSVGILITTLLLFYFGLGPRNYGREDCRSDNHSGCLVESEVRNRAMFAEWSPATKAEFDLRLRAFSKRLWSETEKLCQSIGQPAVRPTGFKTPAYGPAPIFINGVVWRSASQCPREPEQICMQALIETCGEGFSWDVNITREEADLNMAGFEAHLSALDDGDWVRTATSNDPPDSGQAAAVPLPARDSGNQGVVEREGDGEGVRGELSGNSGNDKDPAKTLHPIPIDMFSRGYWGENLDEPFDFGKWAALQSTTAVPRQRQSPSSYQHRKKASFDSRVLVPEKRGEYGLWEIRNRNGSYTDRMSIELWRGGHKYVEWEGLNLKVEYYNEDITGDGNPNILVSHNAYYGAFSLWQLSPVLKPINEFSRYGESGGFEDVNGVPGLEFVYDNGFQAVFRFIDGSYRLDRNSVVPSATDEKAKLIEDDTFDHCGVYTCGRKTCCLLTVMFYPESNYGVRYQTPVQERQALLRNQRGTTVTQITKQATESPPKSPSTLPRPPAESEDPISNAISARAEFLIREAQKGLGDVSPRTARSLRQHAHTEYAVKTMNRILRCVYAYVEQEGPGFPDNLTMMISNDCLDRGLADGKQGGYTFIYSPTHPSYGMNTGFNLVGTPDERGRTGVISFFVSESSNGIHATLENRWATANDPPVPRNLQ